MKRASSDVVFTTSSREQAIKNKSRGRIEVRRQGFRGIGRASGARDLAPEDGRIDPTDADFKKALEELSALTDDSAPEIPPGDENLTSWNQNAAVGGHAVDTSPPDQDVVVGLELVEEVDI